MCLSSTLLPVPDSPSTTVVLPALEREADILEHDQRPEPLAHILELDNRPRWDRCLSKFGVLTVECCVPTAGI